MQDSCQVLYGEDWIRLVYQENVKEARNPQRQVLKGVTTERAEQMQRWLCVELWRYKSGYKPLCVERRSHTVC